MMLQARLQDSRLMRLLRRLARDRGGNTLLMIAAALIPMMALIGGSVDMGRTYLAQTRLQHACDSATLATRKRLGASAAATGKIPENANAIGNRFFNTNFPSGSYGSVNRTFTMTLDRDFSITATASAQIPTTIMQMFGIARVPVNVSCTAQLGMSNIDVMMALDVTGSMAETNAGDSQPKIALLKETIAAFHATLEANKRVGSRIRYGFVPYSTNVNVGGLLRNEWVVDQWTYQSRTLVGTGSAYGTYSFSTAATVASGTRTDTAQSTYAATLSGGNYTCPTVPSNTSTRTYTALSTSSAAYAGPPAGTQTTTKYKLVVSGNEYSVTLSGKTCTVTKSAYTNYVMNFDYITQPALVSTSKWQYGPVTRNVSAWRTETSGCMEERDTYQIDDYDNVDLSRALDLDIDLVPTKGRSATQWRPMYPKIIYGRQHKWDGSGSFSTSQVSTTDEYVAPAMLRTDACPPAAQRLQEMTSSELATYLSKLSAAGSTYHDIGMIWAARLLSPTGLFAADNADLALGKATSRNLIFLTDGQTSALDLSYTSYGFEPVDRRRWTPGGKFTLTQTVENRFAFACQEAKKRNITVWLIAFGTQLNPVMEECAGSGHAFEANNSDELSDAFVTIANEVGDLKLTH